MFKIAMKVVLLIACGIVIGLALLGFSVVFAASDPVPFAPGFEAVCSTDSDCADKFPGTNGDPEPLSAAFVECAAVDCAGLQPAFDAGFLQCPEPEISGPVVAPNGALIKFS